MLLDLRSTVEPTPAPPDSGTEGPCVIQQTVTLAGFPAGSVGAVFCEVQCGLPVELKPVAMPAGSVLLHSWFEGSVEDDCCAPETDNTGGCCDQRLSSILVANVSVTGAGCACLDGLKVILRRRSDFHWYGCATGPGCGSSLCVDFWCSGGQWRLVVKCGEFVLLDQFVLATTCVPYLWSAAASSNFFTKTNPCCTALASDVISVAIALPGPDDLEAAQEAGVWLAEVEQWYMPCVRELDRECFIVCDPCCEEPALVVDSTCHTADAGDPPHTPAPNFPKFVLVSLLDLEDVGGNPLSQVPDGTEFVAPAGYPAECSTATLASPAGSPVLGWCERDAITWIPCDWQALAQWTVLAANDSSVTVRLRFTNPTPTTYRLHLAIGKVIAGLNVYDEEWEGVSTFAYGFDTEFTFPQVLTSVSGTQPDMTVLPW